MLLLDHDDKLLIKPNEVANVKLGRIGQLDQVIASGAIMEDIGSCAFFGVHVVTKQDY